MDENITRAEKIKKLEETLNIQLRLLSDRSPQAHDGIELAMITSEMRRLAAMLVNMI